MEGRFGKPNHREHSCPQMILDAAIGESLMTEVQPWKDDEFLVHCQPSEVEAAVSSLAIL